MNHLMLLLICLGITRTRALPTCQKGHFDCGVGELSSRPRCIPHYWVCDNIYDCTSGTDEYGCSTKYYCKTGRLMCPNGVCFEAHQRCDGVKDCRDGYDELGCTPTAIPKLPVEGSRVSSLLLAFLFIVFMVLALFITRWALQRYPNTAFRLGHTLSQFNRNVIQPRLMQRSSSSRVNITSPRNNEHYFENPMNSVQEPLLVNFTTSTGTGSSPIANISASTSAFSPNNQRQ